MQGCAPLVVKFQDASTGSPTSWLWDLGNGNTSTSPTPGTIYFNPGSYTVKLVVKNAAGIDSVIKVGFINVYDKPSVAFSVVDSQGCTPFFVQFTDLTNAGSGTITQWQWDFGDGNTSAQQFPSNLFTASGSYNITLQVTNSNGCKAAFTRNNYIKVLESPSAGFTTQATSTCSPPVTVIFSNTSTGNNITTYNWDFGDGTNGVVANPSHNYTTPGVFNTVLIVTNQGGCTDTVTKIISIGAVSPDFQAPDTVCAVKSFNITNTSAPSTVSSFWTFGDGTTSTQNNPVKTYTNPGAYNIKLVNNFGACKDSVTKRVIVINAPAAGFSFVAPPSGCSVPITVNFKSTSTGAVTYRWYFGDGGTSTLANPSHIYTVKGVYTVSLIIKNSAGCIDSIVKQNLISITKPSIIGIQGLPYSGCVPFVGTFVPTFTSPEPVVSYFWTFGDGTNSTAANPTHTYVVTGTYNVSLIITTTSGCTDTFTLSSAVKVGVRPAANFTATPLTSCAFQNVQFTNTSTGTTDSWTWSFGDTTFSTDENPLHHYIDTGFFTVIFVAENNGCRDTLVKVNYIYIKPPIASYSIKNYCDTPFVKRFIDKSKGALTYLWNFGDGNTSAVQNPVHTYALPGTYYVKLRVDNPPCYDEFTDTVYVVNEQPVITLSNNPTCKNTAVVISATSIIDANIEQYLWTFGDTSTPATTVIPQITHTYTSAGAYTIVLKITDRLNCKKTVTKANAITVYGPTAKLSHPAGSCINNSVTFTDQSIPSTGFTLSSWTLDYGDGSAVATGPPPFTHVYANAGTYYISYTIKDNSGCADSLKDSLIITKTNADFAIMDSISCRQSLVAFINTSTGSSLTYLWNFGDGTTSNLRTPSHIYTTDGFYTVSLRIKDRFGCVDSTAKDSFIVIQNATAGFALSDSVLTCPPAQVSFTNNSTSYSSLNWYFDDGSTSTVSNPTHFFLNGGIYNVKLVVSGFGSCVDSVIKKVKVTGPRGLISYTPTGHCVPATIRFTGQAFNVTGNFIWDFGDGTTVVSTSATISHTYMTVGRYVPRLLLQDTTINCSVSVFGADTISVSDATAYIQLPPNLFCDSATIAFNDSSQVLYDSVTAYSWNFGDGGTSVIQNPQHTFTSTGIYSINMSLMTKYGCKDTATPVLIKVVKSPAITVTADTSVCINQLVSFSLTLAQPDTSATRYQWTFGNGNTSGIKIPPAQTYSSPGIYNIQTVALNSSGCSDTVLNKLVVHALPAINAGADSIICRGQSLTLTPSGGQVYSWQSDPTLSCTNCTGPLAKPDSTTTYIVMGKDNFRCANTDTVTITVVQPFSIVVSLRDTICQGQNILLSASGADNYTWSPAAGLSSTTVDNPSARPDTTTIYQVVGSDYKNCFTDTGYIPVIVYSVPQFNIIADVLAVSSGSSVTLSTTGSSDIISYNWTPPTGLSCITCPQPQASPIVSTTYTATVTNAGGCIAKDQVTINLLCGNGNVFVPNTFSPNGDGSNDVFYPRGKGINGIRNMRVYNRWGQVVFERTSLDANDESAGWNGTYKGQPASQDVYVYHLEVLCSNGEKFLYKGDVTLIR